MKSLLALASTSDRMNAEEWTVMLHADGKGITAVGKFGERKRSVFAQWDASAMTRRQLLEFIHKFFYSKKYLANP